MDYVNVPALRSGRQAYERLAPGHERSLNYVHDRVSVQDEG